MLKIPFRTTGFPNFLGEDAPRPPYKLAPSALVFTPPPPPYESNLELKTRSAIPEDKNDHDYEILLKVFSRILKNRHFGKLH